MASERTLTGNRFEASYSKGRHYADIMDRKQKGFLLLVDWLDVARMKKNLDGILKAHEGNADPMKPFDVVVPKKRGKLVALNHEDTVELRDLAARLADVLQPGYE